MSDFHKSLEAALRRHPAGKGLGHWSSDDQEASQRHKGAVDECEEGCQDE